MKLKAFLKIGWIIRIFLKGHPDILEGKIIAIGDDYLILRERKEAYDAIVPFGSIAFMTQMR